MKLPIAALLFVAIASNALADDWTQFGDSDYGTYSVLSGSLKVSKNGAGEPTAVITGRVYEKATKLITLEKWYVRLSDCEQHQGKLVTVDMDGKFKYENDFVFGAGSIGAAKAELICGAFDQRSKDVKAKSL